MAELDAVVADINAIPEALRSFYVEKDGKHVLAVKGDGLPGYVPALKFAEFRDNGKKIMSALGVETIDAAIAKVGLFSGIDPAKLEKLKAIDPEEYAALKAKAEALDKKGIKGADDVQAAIQAALAPITAQLTQSAEREKAKDAKLAKAAIRDAVRGKFTDAGGRKNTDVVEFILSRAEEAFRVVDDRVVARDGRFGSDGEPLTVEDWIKSAAKDHPFAFETNGGTAAPTGGGTGVKPVPSTFRLPGGGEVKTEGISVL
jgi:hypothetical protein